MTIEIRPAGDEPGSGFWLVVNGRRRGHVHRDLSSAEQERDRLVALHGLTAPTN